MYPLVNFNLQVPLSVWIMIYVMYAWLSVCYRQWFHDAGFFFLISSLMSLNILFDFWHYYDYFVTSPFIPDLLTVDLWKTKQEKIFNSSDCFFFSSQWFQQSSVITNHCTNKTKNWICWWPWGKTSVLGQIRQ